MLFDVIKAWKDDFYCQSLSTEQRALLPANPAGEMELSEDDMAFVAGGCQSGAPCYSTTDQHSSSIALICEVNVFTLNVNILAVPVDALGGANHNCIQNH